MNLKLSHIFKKTYVTILLIGLFSGINAQIRIGSYDSTFYHVVFTPNFIVEDETYTFDSQDDASRAIDLDNDGLFDLYLVSKWTENQAGGPPHIPYYYPSWFALLSIVNPSLEVVSINYLPDTLTTGDTITSSSTWNHDPSFTLAFNINSTTVDSTWKDKSGYYVGLRIKTASDTLYGWLQIDVSGYHKIILKESACQSTNPEDTVLNPYLDLIVFKNSNDIGNLLKVFPNPFHDKINIDMSKTGIDIKQIAMYSIDGKLIDCKQVDASSYNFDTGGYKQGIFLLKIMLSDNSIIYQKVVK
jgi:hypothetical protein